MTKRFLVAYGSGAGSTAEVAQAIGEEMRVGGAEVEVKSVEDVMEITDYDGVVVGSAVRAFNLLGKTKRFLRKHRKQLRQLPVAFFIVCMTMKEPTPENIEKSTKFAEPMLKVKEPVSLGLFGGCMDPSKLVGIFAKTMKDMPVEDVRDWEKIRAWGNEILPKLSGSE